MRKKWSGEKMDATVLLVSLTVFLWFPTAAVETFPPPTASQVVEDSLKALKLKWESIFDSQPSPNITICRNQLENSSAGCRELELMGNISRAYVYSAEEEIYYSENMMSLCTTHSFFQNIASNLTSLFPDSRPIQLSVTDAYGAYRATLLPEAGIGDAQEHSESKKVCRNGEFNVKTFDPRRAMTYITTTSSPKFVTFLNLVRPSGVHALPAIRTIQYLLTYTLNPEGDFFSFLPPSQSQLSDDVSSNETSPVGRGSSQAKNRTFSAPEAGSGGTMQNSQLGEIRRASESNIAALNNSLERAILDPTPQSVEPLDTEQVVSMLTEQNTANVTIPCTRVLIVIIEEDIGTDLANALLTIPESNLVFQVLFIDVSRRRNTSTGREHMEVWYNIKRVYCESMAVLEESTIDTEQIAHRAASLQSYLNYLSWQDRADHITWSRDVTDNSSSSSSDACIPLFGSSRLSSTDTRGGGGSGGEVLLGTLCLKLQQEAGNVETARDSTCSSTFDLSEYRLLRNAYETSPSPFQCLDITARLLNTSTAATAMPPSDHTPSPTPVNASTAQEFFNRLEEALLEVRNDIEMFHRNASESNSCAYGDKIQAVCSADGTSHGYKTRGGRGESLECRYGSTLFARGMLGDQLQMLNYSIGAFYDYDADIFERLCASEAVDHLEPLMTGSLQQHPRATLQDPAVLWLNYTDTRTGFQRVWPRYDNCGNHGNTSNHCAREHFDPRYMLPYTSTVSGPKRVYLIIHPTKMENFRSMQQAGEKFVRTLTPDDYAAVSLNSHLPFLPANNYSEAMIQFILEQRFSSNNSNLSALTIAFQTAFIKFKRQSLNQICHDLIVLFCDSELNAEIESMLLLKDRDVAIFTYTFGGLSVDPTIQQSIACSHRGAWFDATGSANLNILDDVIPMYLNFFSAIRSEDSGEIEARWTEIYQDGGDVITGCLPIYQTDGADTTVLLPLMGVVCVGLNATRVRLLDDADEAIQSVLHDPLPGNCSSQAQPLTEAERDFLRDTKCLLPFDTTSDILNSLADIVERAVMLHTQAAFESFRFNSSTIPCPYDSHGFNCCSSDEFVIDEAFSDNVTVSCGRAGVISRNSCGVLSYPVNSTSSLCPALIQQRAWRQVRAHSNLSILQWFSPIPAPTPGGRGISGSGLPAYTLTYPALRFGGEDMASNCSQGEYQSQFFPLISSTVSAGKDVVIILHLRSEMPHVEFGTSFYANAIRNLLPTLGIHDFFTILVGNATFSPVLLRATQQNLRNVTDNFLPTLSFEPASLAELTLGAFNIISRSSYDGHEASGIATSSHCQTAVIIITDSEISAHDINSNLTSNSHMNMDIKLFINSNVSKMDLTNDTGREIACNHSGIWTNIATRNDSEAYELINNYYKILASHVRISAPIWSDIRINPQALIPSGAASLCQPVYSEATSPQDMSVNELLGVTCIDLPIEEVRRVDPSGGERFLRDVILDQASSQTCELLTSGLSVELLDRFRPPEGKCAISPPTPTTSPPPTYQPPPSNHSTPPTTGSSPHSTIRETTPSTTPTTGRGGGVHSSTSPTTRPRKKIVLKPSYIAAIVVACVTFFFCIVCIVFMCTTACSKRDHQYRSRVTAEKAGGADEFATDYQKLHENLIKDEEDETL